MPTSHAEKSTSAGLVSIPTIIKLDNLSIIFFLSSIEESPSLNKTNVSITSSQIGTSLFTEASFSFLLSLPLGKSSVFASSSFASNNANNASIIAVLFAAGIIGAKSLNLVIADSCSSLVFSKSKSAINGSRIGLTTSDERWPLQRTNAFAA